MLLHLKNKNSDMARFVIHEEKGPFKISAIEEPAFICMCGLSKNKPYCDNSHMKTLDEEDEVTYIYEGDVRYDVDEEMS